MVVRMSRIPSMKMAQLLLLLSGMKTVSPARSTGNWLKSGSLAKPSRSKVRA